MSFLYFILGLSFLYFSSRLLNKKVAHLVYAIGGSQKSLIILWSLFFLPGTVIHEMSHFLAAILVGARTGKIEILPEYLDDEQSGVALGSVQTQKLNFLQAFFVGLAPFFSGLIILTWLASLIPDVYFAEKYSLFGFYLYLFFVVGNSFFPSKHDLVQTTPFFIIAAITLMVIYFSGIYLSVSFNTQVLDILKTVSDTGFFCSGLNFLILAILSIFTKFIIKLNPK